MKKRSSLFTVALLLLLSSSLFLYGCPEIIEQLEWALTVTVEGEGSVTPASGSRFQNGAIAALHVSPKEGWEFSHWAGPHGHQVSSIDEMSFSLKMDGNKTITAVFEPVVVERSLDITVLGQGAVGLPGGPTYPHGEMAVLQVHPDEDWFFQGFGGPHGSEVIYVAGNEYILLMDGDKEVTAIFEEIQVSGSAQGYVTHLYHGQPLAGVRVMAGGQETITDEEGRYLLTGLPVGSQIISLSKEGYVSHTGNILILEDMTIWQDFALAPLFDEEDELDLAMQLIYDLNDSFAQFKSAVENELSYTGMILQREMGPYMMGVGVRLGLILDVLAYSFGEFNPQDWEITEDGWTWSRDFFTEEGVHSASIHMSDPYSIAYYDEELEEYHIDLTEGFFTYTHTLDTQPDLLWSLEFTMASSRSMEYQFTEDYYDEETGSFYEETYVVQVPLVGEAKILGQLKDSLVFYDELPMEELSVNLSLSFDFFEEEEMYLEYNGALSSKVLDLEGYMAMEFTRLQGMEGDPFVFFLPHKAYFSGRVVAKEYVTGLSYFSGVGEVVVDLSVLEEEGYFGSFLNKMELVGSFTTYQRGQYTMNLVGELAITIDEGQLLQEGPPILHLTFKGLFERPGFHPFSLTISLTLHEEEEDISFIFSYIFGDGKILEGSLSLGEEELHFEAKDANDLTIVIDYRLENGYDSDGEQVGFIYGRDGVTILGEIWLIDYQLAVLFPNGVVIGILF